MGKIIFAPICDKCGYEFKELYLKNSFVIKCPRCKNTIDHIDFIDPNFFFHGSNDGIVFDYLRGETYNE